jgi:hypothetical protein
MTPYSDEIVSAFVDGELEASLMAEVEVAAKDDADLSGRIAAARRNDGILRDAFDEALAGDAPDFLSVVPQTGNVVPFARRAQPVAATPRWIPTAAAASIAFVVGAYAMHAYNPQSSVLGASRDGLVADARLASALSTAPSGEKAVVNGGTMNVSLSFRASDQRLCREFALDFANGGAMGVACRDNGVWHIEGLTSAPKTNSGGFQIAGGPNDSALAPVIKRLGVVAPLDRTGETAAIKSGWGR